MNPEMRLANSTTYWMAWVIWMAHCCHSTSRGCDQNTPRLEQTIYRTHSPHRHTHILQWPGASPCSGTSWPLHTSASAKLAAAAHPLCTDMSPSGTWWYSEQFGLEDTQRYSIIFSCLLRSCVWGITNVLKQTCASCAQCSVPSTMTPLSDSEASEGRAFSIAAHLPLNSTSLDLCKILISGLMLICANILRGGHSNITQCQLAV